MLCCSVRSLFSKKIQPYIKEHQNHFVVPPITDNYVWFNSKHNIGLRFKEDIEIIKLTELPIADRYSTGTSLSKHQILDVFIEKELEDPKKEKIDIIEVEEKTNVSLESIDQRMMTIDDFLDDIEKSEN